MAVLLQTLAIKLGVVTGRDLASACRYHYSRPVSFVLWIMAEVAIAACDLAEVIGSAIALNLSFGIPLLLGVCLTALDVLLILFLQQKGFRFVEALVVSLIGIIGGCFGLEILLSWPNLMAIAQGFFLPGTDHQRSRNAVHRHRHPGGDGDAAQSLSTLVAGADAQFRAHPRRQTEAIRFNFIDSFIALNFALLVNAAILIVAAATFFRTGYNHVAEINGAYTPLTPLLGDTVAGVLFALALLCSGQNSTLTGTLAGQIVMEGFLNIRLVPGCDA